MGHKGALAILALSMALSCHGRQLSTVTGSWKDCGKGDTLMKIKDVVFTPHVNVGKNTTVDVSLEGSAEVPVGAKFNLQLFSNGLPFSKKISGDACEWYYMKYPLGMGSLQLAPPPCPMNTGHQGFSAKAYSLLAQDIPGLYEIQYSIDTTAPYMCVQVFIKVG